MSILIDAWYERGDLTLRVRDCDNRTVLLEWLGSSMRNLFAGACWNT